MNYTFSDRISTLQPSAIREILKTTSDPSVISLAAGNPSAQAFPTEALSRIMAAVMAETPALALQYSVSEGYGPLRQTIADFVTQREILPHTTPGRTMPSITPDQCLIISGAQQALDFAARCLCNEGDTVICESPSFIGALNAFRSYSVNLVGVELLDDGMDIAALEQALQHNPRTRFIYIISNFQNPTGITTSLAKRQAIYDLARCHNVTILEDNPYGDLRYGGNPLPSLKTLDEDGRVIYCGSFSKIIAPGLRLAYVIAPPPVIAKFTVAKQCADVHTNMLAQIICQRFLLEEDISAHLNRLRTLYQSKRDLMLSGIDAHFPQSVACTRPEGGLFLWATLPPAIDMFAFCRQAATRKVAVVPGNAFTVDEQTLSSSFRLNFSTPSDAQIQEGIAILGQLLHETL
ncbi:MAG: PLP-dependent aminotransferase family protein [Peptococcaceae bacterium]|nr:PLP-dependent aminotransferase family protein [Peptococcaceae bacterium]